MLSKLKNRSFIIIFCALLIIFSQNLYPEGVLNGSGSGSKFFVLNDLSGALVFQFQKTIEEDSSFNNLFSKVNRNYLEGGLTLNFNGSVYHPNLLTFNVDLNLIANKTKSIFFSDESLNNSLNNNYNINLLFLKRKTTNLELYARKDYAAADRRFSERFFLYSNKYGFKLASSNKIIPFKIDVYRNIFKSESISYMERDELTDNIELKTDMSKLTGGTSIVRVKARDYSERIFDVKYKSLNIMSDYRKFYGKEKNNSVFALFSFRNMDGDINQELFRGDIYQKHYLKNNLYFLNSYKYTKSDNAGRTGDKHLISLSINHRLFDSLETKINSGGRFESYTLQKLKAFSYGLEFRYRKKIPSGSINIIYMNNAENGSYNSKSDSSYVSESINFSISDSIILNTIGVRSDSINITDNNFTYLYMEGIDYQVEVFESMVTIFRIPGGAIPPGGRVHISYELLSFPDYKFTSVTNQLNIQMNFIKYFYLYFKLNSLNHDISSDYIVSPFQSFSTSLYGIKFASGNFNGEYYLEKYNSDISKYLSRNLRLSLGFNITNKIKITGNTSINRLKYETSGYSVDFDTYYGSINFKPVSSMYLNVIYRHINYKTESYFRDRDSMISKFQWSFRNIILELFYEYILNKYSDSQRNRNYFALRLRRIF